MTREISIGAGEHIQSAATKLVAAAHEWGSASMTFNELLVYADRNSTVASILTDWEARQKARSEDYRNSPEGKRAEQEREKRLYGAQQSTTL